MLRKATAALAGAAPAAVALCATMTPNAAEQALLRERATREEQVQSYVRGEALQMYISHCRGAERSHRCAVARAEIANRTHALSHPPGTTPQSLSFYHAQEPVLVFLPPRDRFGRWSAVSQID